MISNNWWTAKGQCITHGGFCVWNTSLRSRVFHNSSLCVIQPPDVSWLCAFVTRAQTPSLAKHSLSNLVLMFHCLEAFDTWHDQLKRMDFKVGANAKLSVPLCLIRLTQQIKTDYESTKISNNNNNKNKKFKCIHVRNKYILNQNRIKFTIWIWKIQFSVSFVRQSVKDLKHCHVGNQNDLNWNLSIINPKCCYTQANKTCKTRPQNINAIQNW